MLNQRASLDLMFHALADPTRRAMVERLSRGPASVSELAEPLTMSLPALVQHLFDMYRDETRISVSLATVEFKPAGTGTRLIVTEHGAFLDGHDTSAQRERGTADLVDALGAELRRELANT